MSQSTAGAAAPQSGPEPGTARSPSTAPVPIQGGTLLIARDGHTAIAADPDRDRVVIADIGSGTVLATLPLRTGDEPGRMAEDGARQVHVILRGAGQLAQIDLDASSVVSRRSTCAAPQGIAYEPGADLLHVACADGELVSLAAAGGDAVRKLRVDSDLRDVLVVEGKLFVTRFKSAELLQLDASAAVAMRSHPPQLTGPFESPTFGTGKAANKRFEAEVAWRTLTTPDGGFVMVHQRAQVDEIALPASQPPTLLPPNIGAVPVGPPIAIDADGGIDVIAPVPTQVPSFVGPAYGSGVGCDGIVQSEVSYLARDGSYSDGPLVPGMVLAVDAAISPDGRWLAVASAGSFRPRHGGSAFGAVVMPLGLKPLSSGSGPGEAAARQQAGLPSFGLADDDGGVGLEGEPSRAGNCLTPGLDAPGLKVAPGQVIAVAFDGQNRLVVQTRDPNRLRVLALNECVGCEHYAVDLDLGGTPRRDAGHDLFHTNAGAGLACASCHPGGGDDGHVWNFAGIGPRRTQVFNMGVRDTTPLHWDGEFASLDALLLDVFARRMGGGTIELSEAVALSDYIEALRPNAAMRSSHDESAQRGKMLFESASVGCTTCHSGPKFTSNKSVDVGTGGTFQVPSLIGVAYRQPFMHDGCAQTLRQRFDPSCGGKAHGHTEALSDEQIGDLVAYLETL